MTKLHEVCVEVVGIGDPDDSGIFVSFVLGKWENSPQARWCRERNLEIKYHFVMQDHMYGQAINIIAQMDGPTYTEWLLRFK